MTDRVSSFLVILDGDVREDDAKAIESALSMVKGVLAVKPNVADYASSIAQVRAVDALKRRLSDLLEE